MISFHPKPITSESKASYFAKGFRELEETLESFVEVARLRAWSPCVFKDGHRLKLNFKRADWLALDFDDGMSLEDAKRVFCDVIGFIGTTKSHGKSKGLEPARDRFRVVLKLTEPVFDYLSYEYTLKKYIDRYDSDNSAKDAARFFWPCTEIVQVTGEGYTIDCETPPVGYGKFDYRTTEAYGKALVIPPKSRQILRSKLYETGNRNTEIFKCACELARAGFDSVSIEALIIKSECCNLGLNEINDVVCKAVNTVKKGREHYDRN